MAEETKKFVIEKDGEEDIESVPIYRKKRILIPVFLIIVIGVIAWYWYVGNKGYVSTDDAYIDADKATVSSKMLGRIASLKAAEGDTVKTGQVLVVLDTADLKAQEQQYIAASRNATESISLAKVNLDKARDDFERAKDQFKNNIITKEQYDHSVKALETAQAEYNIALTRPAMSKAQQDIIAQQLKNGVIYSPVDGVISRKWVYEGDVVQPGQPIYTIFNLKNIWITAQIEETNLSAIAPGDQVEISVDAFPGKKFSGKVWQIGSNTASQFSLIPPNNASGNFTKVTQRVPVKISFDKNSTGVNLLPGMSVEIRVKEKSND